jgi:hypothetical protein
MSLSIDRVRFMDLAGVEALECRQYWQVPLNIG